MEPNQDTPLVFRAHREWTQAELAERAGVGRGTIGALEDGEDVSMSTLRAIAAALEIDAATLIAAHDVVRRRREGVLAAAADVVAAMREDDVVYPSSVAGKPILERAYRSGFLGDEPKNPHATGANGVARGQYAAWRKGRHDRNELRRVKSAARTS